MTLRPDVDDLELVWTVSQVGSIGAAARRLRISQASASVRLTRLERRMGVSLFTRGPRGASPTAAGYEMARRADHILGHLDGIVDDIRFATTDPPLRIGCFHGLADTVLPLIDSQRNGRTITQAVDHGLTLIDWVAEGMLDAAIVSVAGQRRLPADVTGHDIGRDEMVVLIPEGAPHPTTGRLPLSGLSLPTSTYDLRDHDLTARVVALGGTPRLGATVTGTIRMARLAAEPAIIPRSSAVAERLPGDKITSLPFTWSVRLSMITRPEPDGALLRLAKMLTSRLELTSHSR